MEKNTVIAIVLSSLVLVGSMFIQQTFFPEPEQTATEQSVAQPASVVTPTVNNIVSPVVNTTQNEEIVESVTVVEETHTITTDLYEVVFTNRGGDVISFELFNHNDGDKGVNMADNISATNRAFSLAFGSENSPVLNDLFTVRKIDDYTIGFYKDFTVSNSDGTQSSFTLIKQYSFKQNDYLFRLDVIIDGEDGMRNLNFNNVAYTLRTSPQIGPQFDQKNDRYENRTFMSYSDGKKKKQVLKTGETKVFDDEDGYSWTGVAGKYFTVLAAPQGVPVERALYSTAFENSDYANAQVFIVRSPILQQEVQDTYFIYAGPRTERDLAIYNNAPDNAWSVSSFRLNDSLESSGILSWLEVFLKWALEMCYNLVHNWGVAIIIITVIIKIAFYPLTKKSSMASLKMQDLQPRMKELQEKYKGQPEKLNMEMGKLYQETGYNPLSGCLPLLIQFPIIIAMFNLFNNYFEFRGAMFIPGWIPDLSVGDSVYTLGFDIPFLGNQVRILPVIYVISQLLFGKVTQASATASNQSMKMMMYGMPLIFFFMFYNAPAGLILYWTVSNILQLIQQVIINKVMHRHKKDVVVEEVRPAFVARPKKKK